jgi:hypothetical protein
MKKLVNDAVVGLAQVLVETKHLRDWFFALQPLPSTTRGVSLSRMAKEIREGSDDNRMADAVGALADPQIYKSILQTVQERVAEQQRDRLQ